MICGLFQQNVVSKLLIFPELFSADIYALNQ